MRAILRAASMLAVVVVSDTAWANRCDDAVAVALDAMQRSSSRLQLIIQKRDHAIDRAQAIAEGWNSAAEDIEAEAKAGADLESLRIRLVNVLDGVARERGQIIRDVLIITVELNSAWEDRTEILKSVLRACRS